ncbi:acyl-CoA reductase [Subsaximicrobium wynnwilliamsii]|uniref:Acyl-CoA reductase n=1 Tax=Subsaximicrobium wynnwilliamsii TaxID=291179 RepID=A0A5C6ZL98_9FLAO|nr:acyl-CoA reductase [Subsaximicrobium wynnwilliamsii]TXD81628.1 acyl-CoA reductase [Subsaximicrobium wynnwilliamsii]TXD91044.1 acyl-CoA reductase [Subsaximicrobium wynnwilliamsii]TXE01077.1 acyl-CoA reductase [Subsaximicrobium wynnwilliamsii]
MDLQQRINAFAKLGNFLSQFTSEGIRRKDEIPHNDLFFEGFQHQIKLAQEHNGWFTKENVFFALEGWSKQLTESNLNTWVEKYQFNISSPKTIAIVMAGNIPLVGFHDFLSVLISGQNVLVKQSSNDKHLLPFLAKYLEHVEPAFRGKISFTEGRLEQFDAVIATGSDNTARYFEYYFKDKPSIIRKNRNSIAVLRGNESDGELKALSEDVFRYYGLGCRNVSKIFVPKDYEFDAFFNGMYHWHPIINQSKYANNYDYNKAVYLMSEFQMLENGFLMIKEDANFSSPIATVFYEYYDSEADLKTMLDDRKDQIQCVVAHGFRDDEIQFGQTQLPNLGDYADDVDTISFALTIC